MVVLDPGWLTRVLLRQGYGGRPALAGQLAVRTVLINNAAPLQPEEQLEHQEGDIDRLMCTHVQF